MTASHETLWARRKPNADSYDSVSDDHFCAVEEAEQGDLVDVYSITLVPEEPPEIELVETEVVTW